MLGCCKPENQVDEKNVTMIDEKTEYPNRWLSLHRLSSPHANGEVYLSASPLLPWTEVVRSWTISCPAIRTTRPQHQFPYPNLRSMSKANSIYELIIIPMQTNIVNTTNHAVDLKILRCSRSWSLNGWQNRTSVETSCTQFMYAIYVDHQYL